MGRHEEQRVIGSGRWHREDAMTEIKEALPDEEASHRQAEGRVRSFKYKKPQPADFRSANKALVQLCKSDIIKGLVQVIKEGGENTLHYHDRMDTFWMVLKGRAKFY